MKRGKEKRKEKRKSKWKRAGEKNDKEDARQK